MRVGIDEFLKEEYGSGGLHQRRAQDHFLACLQVQSAIEMQMVSPWRNFDDGGLPHGCPHDLLCGLQIERRFIASHNHCGGRTLGRVEQFFSSASSKCMTLVSLRDWY